jgi:hypothetical protein
VDDESLARVWRETGDPHPHACTNGLVFLTYTVFDYEIGCEVERVEIVPCRSCVAEAKLELEEG